ncbi:hypothetical protein PG985_014396 [Apiospora marii]|uniref:uncharacterized protein n=1 Tax=Apiospora marii TaxID=335849 RepID=UPI00312DCA72
MAPPHRVPHIANRTKSYYFAPRDTARARRVTRHYPSLSLKNGTFPAALPRKVHDDVQGCLIPLDEAGLPEKAAMEHGAGCCCDGFQSALVLNVFHKWLQFDVEKLQLLPESAQQMMRELVRRWGLPPLEVEQANFLMERWEEVLWQAEYWRQAQLAASWGGHSVM